MGFFLENLTGREVRTLDHHFLPFRGRLHLPFLGTTHTFTYIHTHTISLFSSLLFFFFFNFYWQLVTVLPNPKTHLLQFHPQTNKQS
ncbi:hypothetical protein QVD17_38317 [Tagetes erecta]|uniref:Uncharacterized protein n=1 Tax=Tagetes erecta TaxID=13708 RepID=A0AAD8JNM2_TARER|nr:hypothetical protein QVD17_38317 [Tagetes erecta]